MSAMIAVSVEYAIGAVIGAIVIPVLAIIALVKAFTRRTTGWIIAGTIGSLILSVPVLIFVAGFISGLTSRHQRVVDPSVVPLSAITKREIDERETETALKSLNAFSATLQEWIKRPNCGQDKECVAKEMALIDQLARDADGYLGQSPVLWASLQRTKTAKGLSEDDVAKQTEIFQQFDRVAVLVGQFAKALHEYKNSRTVKEMDDRRKTTVIARVNLDQAMKDFKLLPQE